MASQVLEMVRQLLAFLGEFKAAGILDIIAKFLGGCQL